MPIFDVELSIIETFTAVSRERGFKEGIDVGASAKGQKKQLLDQGQLFSEF
jgi:hypothetical protein